MYTSSLNSGDRSGNAAHRQRDYDFAAHRALAQVEQAGRDFGEEVEQGVGTDRHDRRISQAEDEHGEQQYAAPHTGQADEHAHDEANQNFGR